MMIEDVELNKQFMPQVQQQFEAKAPLPEGKFVDSLNEFVKDVNSLQKDSADLTERFIKGEPVDIHDVMIASEKAKTSFQLLMEMRNKFVDMYHEITRMQI